MRTTLTKFIHSRAAAIMLMIVAAGAAALLCRGPEESRLLAAAHDTAVTTLPSPDAWLPAGAASMTVNVIANLGIALLLLVINRTFRLMQSITWLFTGLFFFMQLAVPGALTQFYSGTFLALAVLSLTALLFSTYTDPRLTRSTYLLFLLLAVSSLAVYNLIFFLPVFVLGMIQMKTADMRNILAAIMGCVTPLWILLGTGAISLDSLHFAAPATTDVATDHSIYLSTLAATAFTGALGLIFTFANFIKVMSYNSARRAFNGFFTLLFLATLIVIVADLGDLTVYLPLLNAVAAYQAGHFFASRRYKLSYIPFAVILAIYAGIAALPL